MPRVVIPVKRRPFLQVLPAGHIFQMSTHLAHPELEVPLVVDVRVGAGSVKREPVPTLPNTEHRVWAHRFSGDPGIGQPLQWASEKPDQRHGKSENGQRFSLLGPHHNQWETEKAGNDPDRVLLDVRRKCVWGGIEVIEFVHDIPLNEHEAHARHVDEVLIEILCKQGPAEYLFYNRDRGNVPVHQKVPDQDREYEPKGQGSNALFPQGDPDERKWHEREDKDHVREDSLRVLIPPDGSPSLIARILRGISDVLSQDIVCISGRVARFIKNIPRSEE